MKIYGFVPARMAATRFPGKPLFPLMGRPMLEHVFERAKMYRKWDGLYLCTCDEEIRKFGESKKYQVIMTAPTHNRCLDRVAEAVEKCGADILADDLVICVQGDEPMLDPEMIHATVQPLLDDRNKACTVLAMEIVDEEQYRNPETVKLVHTMEGRVLYTSRSPIPYCKGKFTRELGAKRIHGIFGFRWRYLKEFTQMEETPLEMVESCDSNRILDSKFTQWVAPVSHKHSFSVDVPADADMVEKHMRNDPLWGKY